MNNPERVAKFKKKSGKRPPYIHRELKTEIMARKIGNCCVFYLRSKNNYPNRYEHEER
jgi:hypothetical protein